VLELALELEPAFVCFVPESREEVTTEGGLDVAECGEDLKFAIHRLQRVGAKVSLFIDPDPKQVQAAFELESDMIELHTGSFAQATGEERAVELKRLEDAARMANELRASL